MQFGDLTRSPDREVTEGHLFIDVDNIVDLVKYLKPDFIHLFQLLLQHFGAHNHVHQHSFRSTKTGQCIEPFHQVGTAYQIAVIGFRATVTEQLKVKFEPRIVFIENDIITQIFAVLDRSR